MNADRIFFRHCHRLAWPGYFAKTLTSVRKVSTHEFPRHWPCKKVFHFWLQPGWGKLKIGSGSEKRSYPVLWLAWQTRGNCALLSRGARDLDPSQAGFNLWVSDPWHRMKESAARAGSLGRSAWCWPPRLSFPPYYAQPAAPAECGDDRCGKFWLALKK